jgi:hypothetical protein
MNTSTILLPAIVATCISSLAASPELLPRAEDVLPRDEVSKGSVVVTGEGFRFQVRPEYDRITHPSGAVAYRGMEKGVLDPPAEITLYATREQFSGSLATLVSRETKSAVARGGILSLNGRIQIHIEGKLGPAHRFLIRTSELIEFRYMAVHGGYAYIFHAETPRTRTAMVNAGSELMIRGLTFHVAPPQ